MSTATDADSLRCGSRQGSPLRYDERAAKTGGAPLTAASLRLGGSYGELPLPVLQKRSKTRLPPATAKKLAQICPPGDFSQRGRLALSPVSSQTDKLYGLSL
jgi:hypothetical protein